MEEERLTPSQEQSLLRLARATVTANAAGGDLPDLPEEAGLERQAGAFVSLHADGRLRGCIGTFATDRPIREVVREMAVAASAEDPRFRPVAPPEVPDLEVEISVLSPRRRVRDVGEIRVGTHGLVISRGYHKGVLLPQVATQYGWDRQTFLEQTCHKAGLPADAWKDPNAIIEVFTAQVFAEHAEASR